VRSTVPWEQVSQPRIEVADGAVPADAGEAAREEAVPAEEEGPPKPGIRKGLGGGAHRWEYGGDRVPAEAARQPILRRVECAASGALLSGRFPLPVLA
jgi:hypothetical protein